MVDCRGLREKGNSLKPPRDLSKDPCKSVLTWTRSQSLWRGRGPGSHSHNQRGGSS